MCRGLVRCSRRWSLCFYHKLKKTTKKTTKKKIYNNDFINLLSKLNELMMLKGEVFRARAYQKAMESVMVFPNSNYRSKATQRTTGNWKDHPFKI